MPVRNQSLAEFFRANDFRDLGRTPTEWAAGLERSGLKIAIDFRAEQIPGGSRLTTETRVKATDDRAVRAFRLYWLVVGPFSALIRRRWLRAIQAAAQGERPSALGPANAHLKELGLRLQVLATPFRRGLDIAVAFGRNPPEAIERARERIAERRERRYADAPAYIPDPDWEHHVHEHIGASWPCPSTLAFEELWPDVVASLESRGLEVGRGTFGGWDDADELLARVVWCLAIHLKPEVVVETGVARGLTTRFLLEAMDRNNAGELFSIDLPPLIRQGQPDETGAAVPVSLRGRWTYVAGSSRRRLPALLDRLKRVDLFVHDSMHTTRNVLFELERVWQVLGDRGAIIVDDVDMNRGFQVFTARREDQWSTIGRSLDQERLLGFIMRTPPPGGPGEGAGRP